MGIPPAVPGRPLGRPPARPTLADCRPGQPFRPTAGRAAVAGRRRPSQVDAATIPGSWRSALARRPDPARGAWRWPGGRTRHRALVAGPTATEPRPSHLTANLLSPDGSENIRRGQSPSGPRTEVSTINRRKLSTSVITRSLRWPSPRFGSHEMRKSGPGNPGPPLRCYAELEAMRAVPADSTGSG